MYTIEVCTTALESWIFVYIIGLRIFNINTKIKPLKIIISILIFASLIALLTLGNFDILRGVIKILTTYSLFCLFYGIIFNKSISKSMIGALILYLCMFISEVIIAILASLVFSLFNQSLLFLRNTVIINFLILSLTLLLIIVNNKRIETLLTNKYSNKKSSIIMLIIILMTLALLVFKIPASEWKFNIDFLITMLLLLFISIIGLYLLKQKSDIEKTTSMYQQLAKYSNTTNKVLEDYRMINHEHKNQLSIIRRMIDKTKDKELLEYMDNLLEKKNNIKYKWVADLNRLPLEGLKGLINYKLIEMEENNIKVNVSISKDINKSKMNKFTTLEKDNLYSIIGIYLDNAIDATKKIKNKVINIDMYKESKDIVLIISNTYKGKIDINKISEYGYSTKGKNRGVGLHIVKRIMEENKLYSENRKLVDDLYVQELKIHMNYINKK